MFRSRRARPPWLASMSRRTGIRAAPLGRVCVAPCAFPPKLRSDSQSFVEGARPRWDRAQGWAVVRRVHLKHLASRGAGVVVSALVQRVGTQIFDARHPRPGASRAIQQHTSVYPLAVLAPRPHSRRSVPCLRGRTRHDETPLPVKPRAPTATKCCRGSLPRCCPSPRTEAPSVFTALRPATTLARRSRLRCSTAKQDRGDCRSA